MTLLAVAAAVSLALVLGALWALYGRLGDRTEGFVLAAGGGALMFSAVLELIVPAQEFISLTATGVALMIGAGTFALIDYLIDKRWGDEGGVGFLAAATLDGVPENLALGVALIGAGFWDVSGLAAAIFLSNVPEGASGAKGIVRVQSAGRAAEYLRFGWVRRCSWSWQRWPGTCCFATRRKSIWC